MSKNVTTKQRATALDGAAWKTVRPVGTDIINAAAVSLDALAHAMRGWYAARQELADAEAEAAKACEKCAKEARATGDRLRGEADRRRAEAEAYSAAVFEKTSEVAKVHPFLSGNLLPLMAYASGETNIAAPVTYLHGGAREYVPEVTPANKKALAAFRPVMRDAPDTSALTIPPTVAAAFIRMAEAREAYDAASRTLADALGMYRDAKSDLDEATVIEAESVEKAVAIQTERDNS